VGILTSAAKNAASSGYFQIPEPKLRQTVAVALHMIHDDLVTQPKQPMRKLKAKICSLADELLSTSDYSESLQIATDLIATIHTLLEARSQSD